MNKLWVIAHREYVAMVGTKAFLFTLVMMPILMFGSFLVMPILSRVESGKTQRIILVDETGEFADTLKTAAAARNDAIEKHEQVLDQSRAGRKSRGEDMFGARDYWDLHIDDEKRLTDDRRFELSQEIRKGKLYAFVEITDAVFDENPLQQASGAKFYSQDAMISPARAWVSSVIQQRLRSIRLKELHIENVDLALLNKLEARVELAPMAPLVDRTDSNGNELQRDPLTSMFLPFGVMMLMFLVILMAAQPMLESAMEEKGLRIAEVLLGSVSATQLMGGKLLGNVAASMLIFLFYGMGGYYYLSSQGLAKHVPIEVLMWFTLFQILGVLFFSSIFLTVGASVNELKEAQTLLLPVWMTLMAPMMVWVVAIRDPNGFVATTLSFFPPSCPMMIIFRLATGATIPWWQPPLAAIVMVCATSAMVTLAGRIYRSSLLRTDGIRSISQLLKRSLVRH